MKLTKPQKAMLIACVGTYAAEYEGSRHRRTAHKLQREGLAYVFEDFDAPQFFVMLKPDGVLLAESLR